MVRIEPLEARVAPALFLLQTGGVMKAGADANDEDLATFAGSGLAVVLGKGDELVFDANGDGAFTPTGNDRELARVTGAPGEAIFFFTDIDGTAGFGMGDLTGLALNGGVKVSVVGTIHGAVVTLPANHALADFFAASLPIGGLRVGGGVEGAILSSGAMKNVQVGQTDAAALSVELGILAGTAAAEANFSLNGGTTTLTIPVAPTDDFPGASISKLTLSGGTPEIVAGDAFGPGSGGSISKVKIPQQNSGVRISAGNASDSSAVFGGRGGSISGITISGAIDAADFTFQGGNGGGGRRISGAGGSISGVQILAVSRDLGEMQFIAGAGSGAGGGSMLRGEPETVSAGGAGGGIAKVTIAADSVGEMTFTAGAGGAGGSIYVYIDETHSRTISTPGGRGGAISKITIDTMNASGSATLTGGAGGDGGGTKGGGSGGSIGKLTLGKLSDLSVLAGEGAPGGFGGRGGRIDKVDVDFTGVLSELTLTAGAGADGTKGTGVGGSISRVTVTGEDITNATITAGAGGSAGDESSARGGGGGAIVGLSLTADQLGNVALTAGNGGNGGARTIYIYGGGGGDPYGDPYGIVARAFGARGYYGGRAITISSPGGRGGAIAGVTIKSLSADANTTAIEAHAGDGGAGADRKSGGAGGTIARFNTILAGGLGDFKLLAGMGGAGGDAESSIGARGGLLLRTELTVADAITGAVELTAGAAGEGSRKAGVGGSIRVADLSAGAAFTPILTAGTGVPEGKIIGVTVTPPIT